MNKAMEGRSSSIKELDLSKSDMLFQDSIQDSPKPLMERKEEVNYHGNLSCITKQFNEDNGMADMADTYYNCWWIIQHCSIY